MVSLRRLKHLDLHDVVALLFHVEVDRRVRELTQPRNLVLDIHSKERNLFQEAVHFQFAREQVCRKFARLASWAVVFDDLDHAVSHLFVFEDLLLKSVGVDPFNSCLLSSFLRDVVVAQLIVKEPFDEFFKLLSVLLECGVEVLFEIKITIVVLYV